MFSFLLSVSPFQDAECVLDKKCNPLAVNQNHENAKRLKNRLLISSKI